MELLSVIIDVAGQVAPPEEIGWLVQHRVFDESRFHAAFASAGRRLGRAAIGLAGAARLAEIGVPWPCTSGADECGRAALVVIALGALAPERHLPFVRDLIRHGELREQQAVLRVLAGLPEPARFVDLAIDACRSNVASVFEAIACDNAYPAAHCPDSALHQMVLKALFIGVPVRRIVGLRGRITPELQRMVAAFASERRAAGRPIPDDIHMFSFSHSGSHSG